MKVRLLTNCDFSTSNWSGGETKQLFIYPCDSDFKSRNFDFRISTATVNLDESNFTSLSGFSRKLMVLEGETMLIHENHHSKMVQKFEIDSFQGDWKTKSVGKCSDFNVITKPEIASELYHLKICNDEILNLNYNLQTTFILIYVFDGRIELKICDMSYEIEKGNLLIIENVKNEKISILGKSKSDIIVSEIIYQS